MNKSAIYHKQKSNYGYPISYKKFCVRLRVAKEDNFDEVNVIMGPKYGYYRYHYTRPLEKLYEDELFSYYQAEVDIRDRRVAYIFELKIDGETYYYSEDGLTTTYDYNRAYFNFFQYSYISEDTFVPRIPWTKDAFFYQIFVDRFNMGNSSKNQDYINLKWGNRPKRDSFAGGDLKGITLMLPYLKKLGINAIYLTPIFEASTNHKYNTIDYYKIDPQFGDEGDFEELVNVSHSLGIKIVLDAVFNHVSDKNPYFLDVVEKGKESKYYDWFVIHGDKVDKKGPNYECFCICRDMPKLNTWNKEVQQYLLDIVKYYVERFHIDGYRLDVADEVCHDFWRMMRKELKSIDEDLIIIGENWHDAFEFLQGDQYDSIMNYAFTKNVQDYLCGREDATRISNRLNEVLVRNYDSVNYMMLNLLDSHDTHRLFTLLNKNKDLMEIAFAMLVTYIGIPCMYYGTEIPLEGDFDPSNRRCFELKKKDKNYFNKIKHLIKLRKLSLLKNGKIKIISDDEMLKIIRYSNKNDKQIELVINLTTDNKHIDAKEVLSSNNYEDGILKTNGYALHIK